MRSSICFLMLLVGEFLLNSCPNDIQNLRLYQSLKASKEMEATQQTPTLHKILMLQRSLKQYSFMESGCLVCDIVFIRMLENESITFLFLVLDRVEID